MPDDIKEQVKQALDGGTEPAPVQEKEASPEVKVEEPKVETPKEPVVVLDKKEEQINNLNAALKQEREERKAEAEARKRIETEFNEAKPIIDRFKNFIAPEDKEETPATPKYLTAEEAEAFWQQKQEEQKQAAFKEKQVETIKSEISILEKEWNGADGRPKYSDEEVLKWQQENNKLYLSPMEAFMQKNRNDIIDWEVKQRLAGKNPVQNVEQPGVSPDIHVPTETLPKTDKELRDAIEAAMNSADAEM